MQANTRVPTGPTPLGFVLLFTLGPAILVLGQAVLFALAEEDAGMIGFYVCSAIGVLATAMTVVAVISRFTPDPDVRRGRLTAAIIAMCGLCLLLPVEGMLVRPTPWHLAGVLMILPAAVLWSGLQRERAEAR